MLLDEPMDESNTVVSAYTMYRHLQQYCSHPSECSVLKRQLPVTCRYFVTVCLLCQSVLVYRYLSLSLYPSTSISFYCLFYYTGLTNKVRNKEINEE